MTYITVFSDNRKPIEELVELRESRLKDANLELDRAREAIPYREQIVIQASNRLAEAKKLLEVLDEFENRS